MRFHIVLILAIFCIEFSPLKIYGQTIDAKGDPSTATMDSEKSLASLGWSAEKYIHPNDKSTESGFVKYLVTLNDAGKVIDIELIDTDLTEKIVRKYRNSILKTTFVRKEAIKSGTITKGYILYKINAK
jgi:hypothetical protein